MGELNFVESKDGAPLEITVQRENLSKGVLAARLLFAPLSFVKQEQKTQGKVTVRYGGTEMSCEGVMTVSPLSEDERKGKNGLEVLRQVSALSVKNNALPHQSRFIEYFIDRLAPQLLFNCLKELESRGVFRDKEVSK